MNVNKTIRILIFASENLSLTGGNLYDSLLYKIMKQDTSCIVEFSRPKIYKSGFALKKLITPFLELKLLKKLRKNDVCIWNSVDAYHCFLLAFCVKFLYPGKKTFIIHHHYKFEEMHGIKRVLFKFFEVNFLKMASAIIVPSPYIFDETRKHLPSSRINYLEIAFDNCLKVIESDKIKKGQMLFVGTIEPRKGLHLLLDSLHMLKKENNNFFLNLIGGVIDSKYYEGLLQKVNQYGLENNVSFCGRVTDEEKTNYMKTADVFVFPSLLEGYGMVIVEAMSFGIPVIAFNNSAIPYTVKDGYNGLLAANKDSDDLKRNLLNVLNDHTLRDKLSKGAFETFSKSRKLPTLIEEMKTFVKDLNC